VRLIYSAGKNVNIIKNIRIGGNKNMKAKVFTLVELTVVIIISFGCQDRYDSYPVINQKNNPLDEVYEILSANQKRQAEIMVELNEISQRQLACDEKMKSLFASFSQKQLELYNNADQIIIAGNENPAEREIKMRQSKDLAVKFLSSITEQQKTSFFAILKEDYDSCEGVDMLIAEHTALRNQEDIIVENVTKYQQQRQQAVQMIKELRQVQMENEARTYERLSDLLQQSEAQRREDYYQWKMIDSMDRIGIELERINQQ
jgi:hypothetical protein